jgi:hypothetical protein
MLLPDRQAFAWTPTLTASWMTGIGSVNPQCEYILSAAEACSAVAVAGSRHLATRICAKGTMSKERKYLAMKFTGDEYPAAA